MKVCAGCIHSVVVFGCEVPVVIRISMICFGKRESAFVFTVISRYHAYIATLEKKKKKEGSAIQYARVEFGFFAPLLWTTTSYQACTPTLLCFVRLTRATRTMQ